MTSTRTRLASRLLAAALLPLALASALAALPAAPAHAVELTGGVVAQAADVSYVKYTFADGKLSSETCTTSTYTPVASSTTDAGVTWGEANNDTWYVVNSDVTIAGRVTCSGNVNLVLCDDCSLTASKGIEVSESATLKVYGQESSTGKLSATGRSSDAGIGGSWSNSLSSCGEIEIHGGEVTAKGGEGGAGIGGGTQGSGCKVIVRGGFVKATGGEGGAGIGSGLNADSGTVEISGGAVTATGGMNGAGIGGGYGGAGGNVTISGGEVTATGGKRGAGIGGGFGGAGGTVEISGGFVSAAGGSAGAGIGGGDLGSGGTVAVRGGEVTAKGGEGGAGIGGGIGGGNGNDGGGHGGSVTISGGAVTATGGICGAGIGGGNNGNSGSVTVSSGAIIASAGSPAAEGVGYGASGTTSGSLTLESNVGLLGSANGSTGWAALDVSSTNKRPQFISTAHEVSFNKNGHGTAPNTQVIAAGQKATDPGAPAHAGYAFCGWFTDSACTSSYDFSAKVLRNYKLYAKWGDPISYSVVFDANGGQRTMAEQSFTYNVAQELSDNQFMRTGYTFWRWNTEADGTGTWYENKYRVKNLTDEQDGKVTLYAQWEANSYSVIFDANGGQGTMESQSFTYDAEQALSANQFTREGYVFVGWNTKADGTGKTSYTDGESVKNLTPAIGTDFRLYAQWRAKGSSSVALADWSAAYTGEAIAYAGEVTRTGSTGDVSYSYYSNPACTQAVDPADVVAPGDYYVVAALAEDANYLAATSAPAVLTVVKGTSTVALAGQSKTYTGEAIAYDGEVTRAGSTGAVTFAYYADAACTEAVAPSEVVGAGTYYVVAALAADANYEAAESAPAVLTVAKAASGVKLAAQGKTYTGKALAYDGKVTRTGSTGKVTFRYYSDAACRKAVAASAVRGAGTYYVVAALAADANYLAATSAPVRLTVAKAAGALKVAPAKKALSAKPGKNTTFKAKKAFKVKANASKGKVTYAKVKGAKKISVSKAGKVTVKKGLKAGKTYTVKVRATAAATANYDAASAVVALKVKVQKKK